MLVLLVLLLVVVQPGKRLFSPEDVVPGKQYDPGAVELLFLDNCGLENPLVSVCALSASARVVFFVSPSAWPAMQRSTSILSLSSA